MKEEAIHVSDSAPLPFRWKHEIYKIFVKCKHINQPMDIAMLSAGTKRLFWIMTTLFTSGSETQLIGIEELETHYSPRLLKQTWNCLIKPWNTTLLITSHSPYLDQYLRLENIYIGVPDETGLASFQRIRKNRTKSLINTTQNLGLSIGEYLFDLMSGDSKSNLILQKYINS
jgi:predicted ATPase